MMLARAQLMPLLLLYTTILLRILVCNTALEIHESPTSQVILLGESATYHCSATGGSFRWIINIENVRQITIDKSSLKPEHGITAVINEEYNEATYESDFMATISIEGRASNNNTRLHCVVFTFDSIIKSDNGTLIIIGPPEPPYTVSVPQQHVDLELKLFLAVWNVPYSHSDHPIISYDITVTNQRTVESYESSQRLEDQLPTADSDLNITLPFPEQTTSCDILTFTIRAVNDIGFSDPAVANLSIPEVPVDDVLISAKVLFEKNGNLLVSLEIKFPPLCIFETLNYTVVLANGSLRELVVLQKSVTSPPESVTETITSGIVANTNYSVVVLVETDVWKATTTPYNFSTHLTSSPDSSSEMTPAVGAVSPKSTNSSTLILGVSAGTAVVVLLLIIVAATILWVMCSHKRLSGSPATIEDMKTENSQCEMTPNPIYNGPLYDTVQEPFMAALKLQPLPLPVRAEPNYTESPMQQIQRSVAVTGELMPQQREPEDCYVHMHSFKQQP